MGVPRHRKNNQLPKDVYRDKGWYIYWPYLGKVGDKYKRGSKTRLCRENQPIHVIWERYNSCSASGTTVINLRWLFAQYEQSKEFKKLSIRKQNDRSRYDIPAILSTPVEPPFQTMGDIPLNCIDTVFLRTYIDSLKTVNIRNNYRNCLASAYRYAIQYHREVTQNPMLPIKVEETPTRDNYISDDTYHRLLKIASRRDYAFLELLYLLKARPIEVAELNLSDLREQGVWLGRFKGSLSQLVQWSPRLEQAVNIALEERSDKYPNSPYLFTSKTGGVIGKSGRASMLRRIQDKAIIAGIIKAGEFQLKDLKAKGISDADNLMLETGELNIQVAGHKQERALKHYIRKDLMTTPTR